MALLDKIGKSLSIASRSKAVMGTVAAGAVIKGLSDTVGQSAISNAMDIAFDNPEADRAVLGTDLTPSLLVAQAGLGPVSGVARAMNMDRYGADTGIVGPAAGGAGLGAVGRSFNGFKKGNCWRNRWRNFRSYSWWRSWSRCIIR